MERERARERARDVKAAGGDDGVAGGDEGGRGDVNGGPVKLGILPMWWNDEKRAACEEVAMDEEGWSAITFAVEKHDVQEHYKDDLMSMKLRMLAEIVYGR